MMHYKMFKTEADLVDYVNKEKVKIIHIEYLSSLSGSTLVLFFTTRPDWTEKKEEDEK